MSQTPPRAHKPQSRPGSCVICKRPDRTKIEQAIGLGMSFDRVAAKFGDCTKQQLHYHYSRHTTAQQKAAYAAKDLQAAIELQARADDESLSTLDRLKASRASVWLTYQRAIEADDFRAGAQLMAQLTRLDLEIRSMVEAVQKLAPAGLKGKALFVNAEFQVILAAIEAALKPFPEAAKAVSARMSEIAPQPTLADQSNGV